MRHDSSLAFKPHVTNSETLYRYHPLSERCHPLSAALEPLPHAKEVPRSTLVALQEGRSDIPRHAGETAALSGMRRQATSDHVYDAESEGRRRGTDGIQAV